jgi:hypothetical protein
MNIMSTVRYIPNVSTFVPTSGSVLRLAGTTRASCVPRESSMLPQSARPGAPLVLLVV